MAGEDRPLIVYVDGTIGVGKSTRIKELSKDPNFKGFNITKLPEPIKLWVDENGDSLLDAFYANPCYETILALQTKIADTRTEMINDILEERTPQQIIFVERHPDMGLAFILLACEMGYINLGEYLDIVHVLQAKNTEYENCIKKYNVRESTLLMRWEDDFGLLLDRIKKRGRDCEKNVSIEYLQKLQGFILETVYKRRMPVMRDNNFLDQ